MSARPQGPLRPYGTKKSAAMELTRWPSTEIAMRIATARPDATASRACRIVAAEMILPVPCLGWLRPRGAGSKETSTSNAAFLARRPIGASPGMQDPGRRSVARISRQKALAVVCLHGVASQQGPPLKIGNIVGTSIVRLVGAILLEQNDEWAVQRRYMSLETLGSISDTANVSLPAVAA